MLSNLKWSDTDNFYMNLGCHKVSHRHPRSPCPYALLCLVLFLLPLSSALVPCIVLCLVPQCPPTGRGAGGVRGRQGLPLALQHAHHGPGQQPLQRYARRSAVLAATPDPPDPAGADEAGGGPDHQADVAGAAGRSPRELQEGRWILTLPHATLQPCPHLATLPSPDHDALPSPCHPTFTLLPPPRLPPQPPPRCPWTGTTSSSTRSPPASTTTTSWPSPLTTWWVAGRLILETSDTPNVSSLNI